MHKQMNFLCVACPPNPHFPSFSTFKEVRAHSSEVHGVVLETAVQSATVLPDELRMYLCLLCSPDKREVFNSETSLKQHLESHSSFFLQNWKEFVEIQCRICECVVSSEIFDVHVNEHHPRNLFASNDFVNRDMEEVFKSKGSSRTSVCNDLQPLPETSQVMKKMKSWQASQPLSEEDKLWDDSFKPDQLISKYFSKLLSAKKNDRSPSPLKTGKPCIRVKPLGLLQAKEESSVSPPRLSSSHSNTCSPSTRPTSTLQSNSNNDSKRSLGISTRNNRRSKSRSASVEIPPSRTSWSNKETTECYVCGIHFKNKICFHIQYSHMDMLFRCKMHPCRNEKRGFLKKKCFMFPGQLNRHHEVYHQLPARSRLDTSSTMTGLPASLVRISCSKCSKFVLSSDESHLAKHAKLEHGDSIAWLLFNCRVCDKSCNSVKEVIQHAKIHRSKDQSEIEIGDKESCYNRHSSKESRDRNSSVISYKRYRGKRARIGSSSPSRAEHHHYDLKDGRRRSSEDVRSRSGGSRSRLYLVRSRSTSRNSRHISRRSRRSRSRRSSKSRSRSTESSGRRSSNSLTRRFRRSRSGRSISPSGSPYSKGRGWSSKTTKHCNKVRNSRSRSGQSRSRSRSRSGRYRSRSRPGRRKSPSSSTKYYRYRARC